MKTEFRIISYASDAWREAISLRERILRTAVGLSFDPSELEQERDHIHVGGYAFEKMLASCVLVPEEKAMKMQRVVVDEAYRSRGIGKEMMRFCEDICQDRGIDLLYCHARDSTVNFYLQNDYLAEGDYFMEDDIPLLKMNKRIQL